MRSNWFELAAQQGHAKAMNNAAVVYLESKQVPHDFDKACRYFEAAYQQMQTAETADNAGMCYDSPQKRDFAKAFYYFHIAAKQNLTHAQYALGQMYLKGEGTHIDDALAMYWFRQAALKNDARSLFYMGMMYAEGRGVPKNGLVAYVLIKAAQVHQTSEDKQMFAMIDFEKRLAAQEAKYPPIQQQAKKIIEQLVRKHSVQQILASIDEELGHQTP